MSTRMILPIFLIFVLAGCATSSKKQATQSQTVGYEAPVKTYQKESYPRDYDYDDTWSTEKYEKPAKKAYSEPVIRLSPRQIQQALKNAGYYKGAIDGKIGPKAKEAIIKFQKANGLKTDGIVGKRTSAELNEYLYR